ncbi:MAG: lipid A deacylase LpxR family protein [Pseudomonadota bacterium]
MSLREKTIKTVCLCAIALWWLPVSAQDFYSEEYMREEQEFEFHGDIENRCWQLFNNSVKEFIPEACEECRANIEEFAKRGDVRDRLLSELDSYRCDVRGKPFRQPDGISGWSLFMDQDAIVFDKVTDLNEDRNYTLGLGVSLTGAAFRKDNFFFADWLAKIDSMLGIYKRKKPCLRNTDMLCDKSHPLERINSFDFGMTAFTPGDLEDENPIPGDRPHAALIFAATSRMLAFNDDTAIKTRLVFGMLGLSVAKDLQRYLHNDVGLSKKDPRGWGNQISDGGEPTGLYSVEGTRLLRKHRGDTMDYDLSVTASGSVGYYVDAAVGADFRMGHVRSPYYAHSANPLSVYNHGNCVPCRAKDSYFFLSYRARIVLYNAFLQGQFRDSAIEMENGEVERLLHEAGFGYTHHFSEGFQLSYALNYKSPEFKGVERREHYWGGLYFSWNFEQ